MHVRRGLFRFWIIASVLWVIGFTAWGLHDTLEDAETTLQYFCDVTSPGFIECANEHRRIWIHDFWNMFWGGHVWVIAAAVPFLALIPAWIVFKVGTWVVRGFRE